MPKREKFKAVIEAGDRGGMYVTIPFDVEKVFGKKRVKVMATFDDEPYRGSVSRMGSESHLLGIRKDVREKIGKGPGDEVTVTIEEDLEPRIVTIPADLERALVLDGTARELFERLSFTHQREYVNWIESARRDETRGRRVAQCLEMLREGKRR